MTKRWGVKWFNDWSGADFSCFDLRIVELSIAADDGHAFGMIVFGVGFAIYRAGEPGVYGDGGVA